MMKKLMIASVCLALFGCAGAPVDEPSETMYWDCQSRGPIGLGRICVRNVMPDNEATHEAAISVAESAPASEAEPVPVVESVSTPTPVAEAKPAPMVTGSNAEELIMVTPTDWYALQLIALSTPERLEALVKGYAMDSAIQLHIHSGQDWYILIEGLYADEAEAIQAVRKLPTSLDVKPWIRPVWSLQQAIRDTHKQ